MLGPLPVPSTAIASPQAHAFVSAQDNEEQAENVKDKDKGARVNIWNILKFCEFPRF